MGKELVLLYGLCKELKVIFNVDLNENIENSVNYILKSVSLQQQKITIFEQNLKKLDSVNQGEEVNFQKRCDILELKLALLSPQIELQLSEERISYLKMENIMLKDQLASKNQYLIDIKNEIKQINTDINAIRGYAQDINIPDNLQILTHTIQTKISKQEQFVQCNLGQYYYGKYIKTIQNNEFTVKSIQNDIEQLQQSVTKITIPDLSQSFIYIETEVEKIVSNYLLLTQNNKVLKNQLLDLNLKLFSVTENINSLKYDLQKQQKQYQKVLNSNKQLEVILSLKNEEIELLLLKPVQDFAQKAKNYSSDIKLRTKPDLLLNILSNVILGSLKPVPLNFIKLVKSTRELYLGSLDEQVSQELRLSMLCDMKDSLNRMLKVQ